MATSIDPARVAELLSFSPVWARAALAGGSAGLRDAGARTLATLIAEEHDHPGFREDAGQLALPLA